ncbi:MAG: hypothetical protein ACK4ON_08295, partial [Bacteroidia bacterium]
ATSSFDPYKDLPFIKSPQQKAPYIVFVDDTKKSIKNYINSSEENAYLPLEIKTPVAGNYIIELEGLFSNGEYSSAYLLNKKSNKSIDLSQATALYFDENETSKDYVLVLSKKKNSSFEQVISQNTVSIFATSGAINVKGNFEKNHEVEIEIFNSIGQLVATRM